MDQPIGDQTDNTKQMSHKEALDEELVAKYLLNDLMPEDRLRFEVHYFECESCAKALATAQSFVRGVRPLPDPWWRRLALPVLVPATIALLALIAVQNFSTIPSLKNQLLGLRSLQANTVILAHLAVKGAEDIEPVTTNSATIEMNLPAEAAFPFYRIEIKGQKTSLSQVVPAPAGARISLHVTKQVLGTGSFNATVYGLRSPGTNGGANMGSYYFTIK